MKIIRWTSKKNIKQLQEREIDIHRFIEISSLEKCENYYSWLKDETNLIPIEITIPEKE